MSMAQILPNNIARHFVAVYCKKTKMKEGLLLNLCCYQIHPGISLWLLLGLQCSYMRRRELVSGVLISIAWLFAMILNYFP